MNLEAQLLQIIEQQQQQLKEQQKQQEQALQLLPGPEGAVASCLGHAVLLVRWTL